MSKSSLVKIWIVGFILGFISLMFIFKVPVAVILRILIASMVNQIVLKKIVSMPFSRSSSFLVSYSFCFLLAVIYALFCEIVFLDPILLFIVLIGVLNGFASRCNWEATRISQSVKSVFMFGDDFLAMGLCFLILNEARFMTVLTWIGFAFSSLSVVFFLYSTYIRKSKGDAELKQYLPISFFIYIAVYSLSWGVAKFLERYWALEGISVATFLLGWYAGSLIPGIFGFIFDYFYVEEDKEIKKNLIVPWVLYLIMLAVFSALAIGLQYWSYASIPLVVIQPMFMVSDMIFPALVGLILFSEYKNFRKEEWVLFSLGFIGSLFIIFSFYK